MALQPIYTERLVLIPLTTSDRHLNDFHRIWSNEKATTWSPSRRCTTLEASRAWMSGILPTGKNSSPIGYGVYLRSSPSTTLTTAESDSVEGPMLGVASLLPDFESAGTDGTGANTKPELYEIGYTFHPDAWGKGYATEAVIPLCRVRGQAKVFAGVDQANIGSIRVLEKSGFKKIAELEEERGPAFKYLLS